MLGALGVISELCVCVCVLYLLSRGGGGGRERGWEGAGGERGREGCRGLFAAAQGWPLRACSHTPSM